MGNSGVLGGGYRIHKPRRRALQQAFLQIFILPRLHVTEGPRRRHGERGAAEGAKTKPPVSMHSEAAKIRRPPPRPPFEPRRSPTCPAFAKVEDRTKPFSRRVFFVRVRVLPSHAHESHSAIREWSAGRRQGRGPRHAGECYHPLALRARRAPPGRSACANRLLRARGASPALHRGSRSRLSTAARGNRSRSVARGHRPASFKGGKIIRGPCNGK